jgi:hypothetical protein
MSKHFKLGASLLVAAGSFVMVGAAPANAAPCPNGSVGLGTLTPLAFSCTQGGFTFTLNSFTGFSALDAISFSNPDPNIFTYSLQGNVTWTGATARSLVYSIISPNGKKLTDFTSSISSSVGNPKEGIFDVTGTPGTAKATLKNMTAVAGSQTYATPLVSDSFTAALSGITGNGIQSVQSTYFVAQDSTSPVPGPLPILGAAAAFGFSRKLRSRIKLSA